MTEYQKTYIELKKQFVATNEGPDSVRALYTFKEELEQSEDQQAKEVLVDMYDLLDFKKDAYELLCQIGNRSDKKTLKRLGTLKDYAENWGNHYALPKPKTPEEKQKEKERQAQLGSGRMIPGFEDGILGHKAGDEFDIHVTFPERYHAKDLAGKAVVFKIKLHDVCVRQLPSMNSDFAKKVGGVDTMEEFREKVRKQLYDGRHGGALNHAKDQVLAKLADAAEGELPSVLVESTYQQEMQNVQQQLQMQRMTLNSYLSQIHETRESFTAKLHAGAEKNTRARMALLQIAQQENLVPTDEEIDKMIAERAERTKKTVEEIREKTNIPALKRTEAIRRAADWVIERSTIEEK